MSVVCFSGKGESHSGQALIRVGAMFIQVPARSVALRKRRDTPVLWEFGVRLSSDGRVEFDSGSVTGLAGLARVDSLDSTVNPSLFTIRRHQCAFDWSKPADTVVNRRGCPSGEPPDQVEPDSDGDGVPIRIPYGPVNAATLMLALYGACRAEAKASHHAPVTTKVASYASKDERRNEDINHHG